MDWRKKKKNCGNGIAEILGRNLVVILAMKLPKMRGKKILWQPSSEIGEKKI